MPTPIEAAHTNAAPRLTLRSSRPSGGGPPPKRRHAAVITRCVTTTETAVAPALTAFHASRFCLLSTAVTVGRAAMHGNRRKVTVLTAVRVARERSRQTVV